MQDDSMNRNSPERNPKETEKWILALSILKTAVKEAGVTSVSEYKGEPLDRRWHLFYEERPNDVILKMFVQGYFGSIHADVSLIISAKWILDEVDRILSQPDAGRLLDFTEQDRPELLRENTRMILRSLVTRIPVVAFHSLSKALSESVDSHLKLYVGPLLKDHWRSLGLPEDYTLTPSVIFTDALQGVDDQFKALREELRGNKRVRLTAEARANLANEHEELRAAYEVAKDHYKQTNKAFFLGKRNRTLDEWEEEWRVLGSRLFPDLFYGCLNEINSYQPFELAHMHLADFYGYSPQYMVKLVTQSSNLKPRKSE